MRLQPAAERAYGDVIVEYYVRQPLISNICIRRMRRPTKLAKLFYFRLEDIAVKLFAVLDREQHRVELSHSSWALQACVQYSGIARAPCTHSPRLFGVKEANATRGGERVDDMEAWES